MATSETANGTLSLRRTESVHASDRVRHVDELTDEEFEQVIAVLESDPTTLPGKTGLTDGELIVFTDYYRVTRI